MRKNEVEIIAVNKTIVVNVPSGSDKHRDANEQSALLCTILRKNKTK